MSNDLIEALEQYATAIHERAQGRGSSTECATLYAAVLEAAHRSQQEAAQEPVDNCCDPMCACHGGPCAECQAGQDERDRATGQAWRENSSLEKWFPLTAEELTDLRDSRDFYRRRVELLQKWQQRMRDPERTIVCDIIANGQMLPDANGKRYGTYPSSSDSDAKGVDAVGDDELLEWLLLNVSGREFRRIGVHYSGNARRSDVRAAMAASGGESATGENHGS